MPHLFTQKEDIEIVAFLVATIAWGNRKMIINSGKKLIDIMGNSPYDFVMEYQEPNEQTLQFKHRTFNGVDLDTFFRALHQIYHRKGGLEQVFATSPQTESVQDTIAKFKSLFFEIPHQTRTQKHISDPSKGSAAKRINMFLRWMVRADSQGVDFGLWQSLKPSQLSCPLDVHSGRVARKLQLLNRKQNDQKALKELDTHLRILDPQDPVKYDFALFGLGVFENF